MHRVDTVGNSPGVRWKLVEGLGSLPGWRKGVRQKKIETRQKIIDAGLTMVGSMKLQPNNGLRSSFSIGPGFGRCCGFCREFAGRFAQEIGKLTGNTSGDHQGEDQKTCHKYVGGYRIGGS
ncbi:hypothetical protein GW17_00061553 [Ensete ventricosum]|nr:hypothetical protein GW17_00061553 [Ensete ventricosum]